MIVAVSGSHGLVGRALVSRLRQEGHEVVRLVRRPPENAGEVLWNPDTLDVDAAGLEGLDAVVHLAGENIADGRWTAEKKQRIRRSRVEGTRLLADNLTGLQAKPQVLVCASALGFYGDRGEEACDESTPPGEGFLPQVCVEWEAAADPARQAGIRTVHLRIGIVLDRREGALARMLPLFRLGLGGPLGGGDQYWSWIGRDDLVSAFLHAVQDPTLEGPVNATAPEALTNRDFSRILGRVLGRPAVLPAPAFALRLALGEMADELLLSSTRVVPRRLVDAGFAFAHPTLESALRSLLGRPA